MNNTCSRPREEKFGDIHKFKEMFIEPPVSRYDVYIDPQTKQVFIVSKEKGTSIPPIPTGEYFP
jgi:hypothetical protein